MGSVDSSEVQQENVGEKCGASVSTVGFENASSFRREKSPSFECDTKELEEELLIDPDTDDYDPRKPEYIRPATAEEAKEASRRVLHLQVKQLERAIVARAKEDAAEVLALYHVVLSGLSQELLQNSVVAVVMPVATAQEAPKELLSDVVDLVSISKLPSCISQGGRKKSVRVARCGLMSTPPCTGLGSRRSSCRLYKEMSPVMEVPNDSCSTPLPALKRSLSIDAVCDGGVLQGIEIEIERPVKKRQKTMMSSTATTHY